MAKQKKQAKGKKNRKHGRNESYCAAYASNRRRDRNKLRRLNKHLRRFPGDGCAHEAVARIAPVLSARWRSGDVAVCKIAHPGSIPGLASKFKLPWWLEWIGTRLLNGITQVRILLGAPTTRWNRGP